ncbi:putative ribonuclease H-like domain-containing protein [Tanacetum coccineum]
MTKNLEEHGLFSSVQQRTNHKDFQNCLFACFLSQVEPKKVIQALQDPSWIEAMQDELLQFKLQKVGPCEFYQMGTRPICTKWALGIKRRSQMMSKSAFLYGKIEVEVYVCQPPGFTDPDFPDRVYKVEKALYGLHQAPKACTPIETQKLLLKDEDVCTCARYQVNPKVSHLHAVKRIFRYLKGQPKLGIWYPKDSPFDLVAYIDSDYARASLDRKSTIGGCQFLRSRLISWQCKKQTMVANSTTEVEYVAASSCCGQVLWIQNQLLDYGYNFLHTKIFIDNNSTDCLPNATIFEELTRMGYEKLSQKLTFYKAFFSPQWKFLIHTILQCLSAKTTAWNKFSSTLAPAIISQQEQGECLEMPTDPYHTPTIIQPSTSHPLMKQRSRRPKRKDTQATLNEPSSLGTSSGSGPRRQDTIGDTITQTGFENVSKTSNDSLLAEVNTPRSDEDSLKLKELMELCAICKIERVESFDEEGLGKEDASKQGRIAVIDADAGINLVSTHFDADTDMFEVHDLVGDEVVVVKTEVASKDFTANYPIPEAKRLVIHEEEQATTLSISSQQPSQLKVQDKGKGKMVEPEKPIKKKELIRLDEEIASKLQAKFDKEVRLAREKAEKEEEANIVSWDNVQAMIDADYQMAQQMQAEEQEKLSIKEKSKLFVQLLEARKKHFAAMRA